MDLPKAHFQHLFHSGVLGASYFPDATAQKVPPIGDIEATLIVTVVASHALFKTDETGDIY